MWECDACRMQHSHHPDKHSLRRVEMPEGYVENMDWNPDCHCGFHEVRRDVVYNGLDLPAETQRKVFNALKAMMVPASTKETIYA